MIEAYKVKQFKHDLREFPQRFLFVGFTLKAYFSDQIQVVY